MDNLFYVGGTNSTRHMSSCSGSRILLCYKCINGCDTPTGISDRMELVQNILGSWVHYSGSFPAWTSKRMTDPILLAHLRHITELGQLSLSDSFMV